jgi:hypothetical protein
LRAGAAPFMVVASWAEIFFHPRGITTSSPNPQGRPGPACHLILLPARPHLPQIEAAHYAGNYEKRAWP